MNIFDFCIDDMRNAFYKGVVTTNHGLEWGSIPARDPYGTVHWNTEGVMMRMRAHRVAWVLENGPIPDGYVIDHDPSCPKSCVTALHFLCLTPSEHHKLGWERGEMKGSGTFKDKVLEREEPFKWQQESTCPRCGLWFVNHSQVQIYCSNKCQTADKEERRKIVRYPRPDTKICEWCEEKFTPKRADTKFCSRPCIDADQYSKRDNGKFQKVCANQKCQQEFTHNLERVQCCSKSCAASLRLKLKYC